MNNVSVRCMNASSHVGKSVKHALDYYFINKVLFRFIYFFCRFPNNNHFLQ